CFFPGLAHVRAMTLTAREYFAARRTKFPDICPKARYDALLVRYVSPAKAVNVRCAGFLLLLGPAIFTALLRDCGQSAEAKRCHKGDRNANSRHKGLLSVLSKDAGRKHADQQFGCSPANS